MPKRRVNVDRYSWRTPVQRQPGVYETHVASRGDVVDVPTAEVDRVPGALVETEATIAAPAETPLAVGGTPLAQAVGAAVVGEIPSTDPGGITAPDAPAPTVPPVTPDLSQVLTEEQIGTLSVPLVQAYVVEHPDELDRVLDLEQNRTGGPRKGVTDLAR